MTHAAALDRLKSHLSAPVSAQSLAVIRILFGAILFWDFFRYISDDRMARYYIDVKMTFPYFGMDFLQPLPGMGMHLVWLGVGVTSFCVMIGLFFRAAIIGFILLFGYVFLLDRAQYLNHNYMVLLYAVLLALSPANRLWSVDAWLSPSFRRLTIPRWPVTAIKLQTEIILVYAGIVKITDDWLRGEPLRMWTHQAVGEVWIAPIFLWDPMVLIAAWGTVVLHIFGAPLLLWSRTRLWIFLIYCAFHISNAIFFNIGIFPWLTIAISTIFFAPDWPQQIAARAFRGALVLPEPRSDRPEWRMSTAFLALLGVWFAVQVYLPERQALFPNLVGWTGDGHRFSWRMRIYDRDAEGWFEVTSADGLKAWRVDPLDWLTSRQTDAMLTRPDMIHDFARKIETIWAERGEGDVSVRAHIMKSLNGRPAQPYVDPAVDLTAVSYNWFAPDPWVLPLKHRAATEWVPDWLPPLPLQKPRPAAPPGAEDIALNP